MTTNLQAVHCGQCPMCRRPLHAQRLQQNIICGSPYCLAAWRRLSDEEHAPLCWAWVYRMTRERVLLGICVCCQHPRQIKLLCNCDRCLDGWVALPEDVRAWLTTVATRGW